MSKKNSVIFVLAVVCLTGSAFGWGPLLTHPGIVDTAFTDSTLYNLAREFLSDSQISSIRGFQGDLFGDHHNEYSAFTSRAWTSSSWWSDVDEITKLQYLGHNCGDSTVPVDHYPANTVFRNGTAQNSLEVQVETGGGGYAHSLGDATWSSNISFSYTGTYSDIMSAHYNAVRANAGWYQNAWNDAFWPWEYSDANHTAGWTGVNQGSKFARVIFTDYFLSRKDTVANANGSYAVNPGGSVGFSSAGSQDPDSVTWNSNASYYNNGGGINSYAWDLNNDGSYETSGANPGKSHSELVSLVGYTEGRTISLRVTDDEGKSGYNTATLAVYSNPTAEANGVYNVYEGGSVQFVGSGGDADGGSVGYAWDRDNDGSYETGSQNPTFGYGTWTPSEAGHTVVLRVTDNENVTTTDTAVVRVYSNPTAGSYAQYGWIRGLQGSSDFDYLYSQASDADGGSVTTQWDLNNDGTWDATGDGKYVVGNDFYNAGLLQPNENHTVTMRGVDNEGQIVTQSGIRVSILVNPNCEAGGNAAAYQGGNSAQFSGSANDPDGGSITQYRWDINNDGTWDITTASATLSYNDLVGAGYNLSPSEAGYTVRFNVIDNDADFTGGAWYGESEDTTTLYLYSLPTADALEKYALEPGSSIAFSATGSDADGGGISQWLWDLDGDGQYDDFSGTGSMAYADLLGLGLDLGEWLTIGLKVIDNEGQAAYDSALLALYPSILGDANGDGDVDLDDLGALADSWGSVSGGWGNGDFDLDGDIDLDDLGRLADNWGATSSGMPSFATPEPTTLSLMAFGVLAVVRRRLKKA